MAVDEAPGRRTRLGLAPRAFFLSRFTFIKIDLRWIYSGYWLALAAQSRSMYNTEERIEIEIESSEFFFPPNATSLSRMPSRSLLQQVSSDILIFSRKNKKKREEKKIYE